MDKSEYAKPETLENGEVLLKLKSLFMQSKSEETLIAVLSCLHDSKVLVPMMIADKPDILRNPDGLFYPMFSNEKQIPEGYVNGTTTMKMPVLTCIEKAKEYKGIKGLVLDPFTTPLMIEFNLAEVIVNLKGQME